MENPYCSCGLQPQSLWRIPTAAVGYSRSPYGEYLLQLRADTCSAALCQTTPFYEKMEYVNTRMELMGLVWSKTPNSGQQPLLPPAD